MLKYKSGSVYMSELSDKTCPQYWSIQIPEGVWTEPTDRKQEQDGDKSSIITLHQAINTRNNSSSCPVTTTGRMTPHMRKEDTVG